jgi:hypothetical protein
VAQGHVEGQRNRERRRRARRIRSR